MDSDLGYSLHVPVSGRGLWTAPHSTARSSRRSSEAEQNATRWDRSHGIRRVFATPSPVEEREDGPVCSFVEVAEHLQSKSRLSQPVRLRKIAASSPWERLTKPSKESLDLSRSLSAPDDSHQPRDSFAVVRESIDTSEPISLLEIIREIDSKSQKLQAEYHSRIHMMKSNLDSEAFTTLKDELAHREVDYIRFLEMISKSKSAKDVFSMMINSRPSSISNFRGMINTSATRVSSAQSASSYESSWKPTFDSVYDEFVKEYEESVEDEQPIDEPDQEVVEEAVQEEEEDFDTISSNSSFYSDYTPIQLSPTSTQKLIELKRESEKYKPVAVDIRPLENPKAAKTKNKKHSRNAHGDILEKFNKLTKKGRRNQGVVMFLNMEQRKEKLAYYFDAWVKYTRKRIETFRTIFWPMYVWRRYTLHRRPYSTKGHLLADIVNTVRLMRYMRPWIRYHRYKNLLRKNLEEFKTKKKQRLLEKVFDAWWNWYEPKMGRYRKVHSTQFRNLRWRAIGGLHFKAWYLYAKYRKTIHKRGLTYIGRITPPGLSALKAPTKLSWMHQKFVLKDIIHRRICQFMSRRILPQMVEAWRNHIFEKRKKRYAYKHWRLRVLKFFLKNWKKTVSLLRAVEEQKKLNQAKSRKIHLESYNKYLQTLRSIDPSTLSADEQVLTRKIEDLRRRDGLNRSRQKQLADISKMRDHAVENYIRDQTNKQAHSQVKESDHIANQVTKLRRRVAIIFLMKLDSFVEKYRMMQLKKCVRRCFNSLAGTILFRRAVSFCNRQLLKRLITFCTRLRKFHQRVVWRYRVSLMWKCLSSWRFVVKEYRGNRTPEELSIVRRRYELFGKYSRRAKLGHDVDDMRSCFYRLLEYSQRRIAKRKLIHLIVSRRIWRVFHKAFIFWKFRSPRLVDPLPEEDRISADLWLWADYFGKRFTYRDQMIGTTKDRKVEVTEAMLGLPKFRYRKKCEEFESELDNRIRYEQSLLLLYFETHPSLLAPSKHIELVRLRNVELRLIFDYCRAFGSYLMSDSSAHEICPSVKKYTIAFGLARWLFEARAYQLIKLNHHPSITVDPELPVTKSYWRHIQHLIHLVTHPEFPNNIVNMNIHTFQHVTIHPALQREQTAGSIQFSFSPEANRSRQSRKSSFLNSSGRGSPYHSHSASFTANLSSLLYNASSENPAEKPESFNLM